jgi:glycosyltransferase involved in cell wall biosynthesis
LGDVVGDYALFDVSLVVALHREGVYLQRSLISLREASQIARSQGITVEFVATLDRADEVTRRVLTEFGRDGFDGWTVIEVNHGSLGASRNSGVAVASGRYIGTCDGDDLVSDNWIAVSFAQAKAAGPETLIFPEYIYQFGEKHHGWRYHPLRTVTALSFIDTHPYISRVFAHRSVFDVVQYADIPPNSGYAYEDWHFNAECAAHGFDMLIADDTILFYRSRFGSLMMEAAHSTTRQIPPCSLFEPEIWLRITAESYANLEPFGGTRPVTGPRADISDILPSGRHRGFIAAAHRIEPAIHPVAFQGANFGCNLDDLGVGVGLAYYEICKVIVEQRYNDVFLLPFIAKGGADRYVADVMWALYRLYPTSRMLIVLGQTLSEGSLVDRVPPTATVIDLSDWPALTLEQRQLLALKLIQATAPDARLHLRPSPFADGFYGAYSKILDSNQSILYRFSDSSYRNGNDWFTNDWQFRFVSEHVPRLHLIISDNSTIVERDQARLGVFPDKWKLLPACHTPISDVSAAIDGTAGRKGRVLWASRLDREKRPELLAEIATRLARGAPDVMLDVYGSAVLDTFDPGELSGISNIAYCGEFDGLASIGLRQYDALVYTTAFDGMPNVILEALGSGLPVIAPDVGGIAEMIVHGETGLLVPNFSDDNKLCAAYVEAIRRISDDCEFRHRIVSGGMALLERRHSPAVFAQAVRSIFATPAGSMSPDAAKPGALSRGAGPVLVG